MRTSKKIVSLVLAVMMVATMMVVGTIAASATSATDVTAVFTNGGTIALDSDVSVGNVGFTVGAGKTVVLDLAGHTITASRYAIYNNTNGNLTIKDSVGGGKVNAQEACVCTIAGVHDATTTIESGTFTSADNGVLMGNGSTNSGNNTWNINGGTFNGNIQSANYIAIGIYAPNDDVWNVNGGTFNITNGAGIVQRAGVVNVADGVTFNVTGNGDTGKAGDSQIVIPSGTGVVYDSKANYPGRDADDVLNVTGGTFNTEKEAAEFINQTGDTNDHIVISGGSFDTAPAGDFVTGGTKTANGRTYVGVDGIITTEEELNAAAVAGGKYVLANDVAIVDPAWVSVYEDLTLDLGGHKITSADSVFVTGSTVDLKVSNGTLESTMTANDYIVYNYGTFTLAADATISGPNAYCNAIISKPASTTDIYGTVDVYYYGVYTQGNSTVNVYDGAKITSDSASALSGNGSSNCGGYTMNVYGGELTSTNDVAIYHPNVGTLNVSGGTIKGATAVYIKSGTTSLNDSGSSITGGTFIGTGAPTALVHSNNGCNPTGEAIVVENCGYPGGTPDIAITAGTFESEQADNAVASYGYDSGTQTYDAVDEIIYGGTYSSDVMPLVAKGLETASAGGGNFVIQLKENPIEDNTKIEGYQNKVSETCVRIWTSVDRNFLDQYASDFGYLVTAVSKRSDNSDVTQENAVWTNLKVGADPDVVKKISCKGTYNTNVGHDTYDDITLAVKDMGDGKKVAARFYAVIDGVTYYAKYTTYDGIVATYTA